MKRITPPKTDDARELELFYLRACNLLNLGGSKGTTAQRPKLTVLDGGYNYFDITLAAAGKPIFWTGTQWVDSTGSIV